MKTKLFRCVVLTAVLLTTVILIGADAPSRVVVHEWGTFTSLQGSDGVPLKWNSVDTVKLPGFVYNWNRDGYGRKPNSPYVTAPFSKGAVTSLQRMETPVIYFYSDKELTVDIDVHFPHGLITEWFPQAERAGPSTASPSPTVAKVDSLMQKANVPQPYLASSILGNAGNKDSLIGWTGVRIIPTKPGQPLSASLPKDSSGNHYLTARETDSAELVVTSSPGGQRTSEREKFLFYRGIGDFPTPLTVRMNSDDAVAIANTGAIPLHHLFVVSLQDGMGRMVHVESLNATTESNVSLDTKDAPLDRMALAKRLRAEMAAALVTEGLYPREAVAMVNTWTDSWFSEEGVRVLYVLPRAWTDATLPLRMNPKPAELVRVMVGRAEVVSPSVEKALTATPLPNDAYRSLGRFAPAAVQRAVAKAAHP